MSFKKTHLSFLLDSNLFVALCVVALSIRTTLILELNIHFSLLLFIFFSTLFTYHFQRLVRIIYKEYALNNAVWYKSNFKLSVFFVFFSLIACLLLAFELNFTTLILLLPMFAISFLYPFKFYYNSKFKISLRETPFLKIFLIAIVWTFVTTILVANEDDKLLWHKLIPIIIDRFCFVLAITIPFDIRDLKYDDKRIKTIPILFGVTGSKIIAYCFVLLSIFSVAFQFYFLNLNYSFFLSHLFTCVIALILIKYSETSNKDTYYSFLVEGLSLLLLVSYFLIP